MGRGLDSSGFGKEYVSCFCEHDNGPSSLLTLDEFFSWSLNLALISCIPLQSHFYEHIKHPSERARNRYVGNGNAAEHVTGINAGIITITGT